MTRLSDIGRACGVSVRTVRRVLENASGVSQEKRELVLECVKKMNYIPNIAARNLRRQSTNFIGIIGYSPKMSGEVFERKTYDLLARLEVGGFYPLMATMPETPNDAIRIMKDWSGMTRDILVMASVTQDIAEALCASGNRFYWIDQSKRYPGSNLSVNRAEGISEAVRYLHSCGHRKIVHCGSLKSRQEGFLSNPEQSCIEFEYIHVFSENTFKNAYACSPKLVALKPDAIFFDIDRMAFAFLKYAAENGIRIPADISVIGFDDDFGSNFSFPSLSTVAHPYEKMNARLVELIGASEKRIINECMPTRFIPRESVTASPGRNLKMRSKKKK